MVVQGRGDVYFQNPLSNSLVTYAPQWDLLMSNLIVNLSSLNSIVAILPIWVWASVGVMLIVVITLLLNGAQHEMRPANNPFIEGLHFLRSYPQWTRGIVASIFAVIVVCIGLQFILQEHEKSALILTKILSPPLSSEGSKTRVWLRAVGKEIYTLNSLTTTHYPSIRGASASSKFVEPVETDTLIFNYSTTQTKPLDPIVQIAPNFGDDPQKDTDVAVDFTFRRAEDIPPDNGTISVLLKYHTATGNEGTLLLAEPDGDAVKLAKFLDTNVRFEYKATSQSDSLSQVITPSGVQIGFMHLTQDTPNGAALDYEKSPRVWELFDSNSEEFTLDQTPHFGDKKSDWLKRLCPTIKLQNLFA